MKKQCINIGLLAVCLFSINLAAQEKKETREVLDEVVLSATKFNLKKENTGKVINKITQKQIKENAGKTVIKLLNNVVGVEIRGTNSVQGEPRSTYIRGGNSRQVLVLIDGIPVSDPTGIEQYYDLRMLSLNQIESIEILKGSSSTLYGSGAGTAVINIILKKSSKKSVTGTYEVNLGTNNAANNNSMILKDRNQNVFVNGTFNRFSYNTSFNISGVDGISAAKDANGNSFETDAFTSKNGFIKVGYKASDKFNVNGFVNYDKLNYDYDAGAYQDSDINNGNQEQLRFGFKPSYKYSNGEVYLLASLNTIQRNLETFNSFSNTIDNYSYKGQSINLDLVNRFNFSPQLQIIAGINYQKHNNESTSPFTNISKDVANFNTIDPYISAVYITDFGLTVNAGSRLNNHSNYGSNLVYDANLAYVALKDDKNTLKALTSYSTAFIAPSLYQLFSDYGNPDLNPERNKTLEFGFDYSYQKQISVSAVYFNRTENDKVIFQSLNTAPWGIYANAANDIKVSGLETEVRFSPIDIIDVNLGYTYVNKNQQADYIPSNKIFANVNINAFENAFVSLVYKNTGERTYFDQYGSFGNAGETVILDAYSLFDINANYKILKGKVTLFASVTNLFNEDYEETLGYNTRGRNYRVGLRFQF